jgi:hypothetical protein
LDFAQVAIVQHPVANIQVDVTNSETEKFNVESHLSTWAPCCYAQSINDDQHWSAISIEFGFNLNSIELNSNSIFGFILN